MMHVKKILALIALAVVLSEAKPSHPYGFHGVPDHLDLAPPILPPAQFHTAGPAPLFPHHHARLLPSVHFHTAAAAPLLPPPHFHAEAPILPPAHFHSALPAPVLPEAHFHQAVTPLLPAPAPLLPAPAPLLPAPAPVHFLPQPVFQTHAHVLPAPTPILPPVYEALPFATPLPSYRAIPGPKTTTHHVSVGYAFPQPHFAKLHAAPAHAHLHASPLSLLHHKHHSLF